MAAYSNPLSETLSLNLVLYNRGGKFMPKATVLYLMNEQGEQLDDIEMNVN